MRSGAAFPLGRFPPVGPGIGSDHPAMGSDHPRAERRDGFRVVVTIYVDDRAKRGRPSMKKHSNVLYRAP
jgi:hypothetical protein